MSAKIFTSTIPRIDSDRVYEGLRIPPSLDNTTSVSFVLTYIFQQNLHRALQATAAASYTPQTAKFIFIYYHHRLYIYDINTSLFCNNRTFGKTEENTKKIRKTNSQKNITNQHNKALILHIFIFHPWRGGGGKREENVKNEAQHKQSSNGSR